LAASRAAFVGSGQRRVKRSKQARLASPLARPRVPPPAADPAQAQPLGFSRRCSGKRSFGNESSRELKGEVASMNEWSSYTPEGRPLVVRREQAGWVAKCGDGPEARSELLDLALIE